MTYGKNDVVIIMYQRHVLYITCVLYPEKEESSLSRHLLTTYSAPDIMPGINPV